MAAARGQAADERVPYAFEKRVMARLKGSSAPDQWGLWANALWRGAAPCLALMLFLSAWSVLAPGSTNGSTGDLGQDFERTVLAAADQESTPDLL